MVRGELYRGWGNSDKATEWRKKLQQAKRSPSDKLP